MRRREGSIDGGRRPSRYVTEGAWASVIFLEKFKSCFEQRPFERLVLQTGLQTSNDHCTGARWGRMAVEADGPARRPSDVDGGGGGKGKERMTPEAVAELEASRMIPLIDISVTAETPKVKEVTRRDRVLAAGMGAIITSLTSAHRFDLC